MSRPKGTGCVYQRGTVWWLKYSRYGRAYRESTHSTDKRKAEKMLKIRLAEITSGTFVGPQAERVRVEELADDLLREYRINGRKSMDDVETRWKLHLKPFFGVIRAVDVTSEMIARYVDSRQRQEAKNATINRELAALKRMFHLGLKATPAKVLRIPAFPHLNENNVRKGFLEDGQYRKIVAYCPELWFRAIVECGRTYGWRISELLNMQVNQIDLAQKVIRLEPGTTKNGEGREVFMTNTVFALLTTCVTGKAAGDFVFTRSSGKRVKDFRTTWENACEAAGVPGLLFHDLRRTAARNLRRAGVPETVIMKIGGWRTRSVFERYAIVSRTDIADAMRKLQQSERLQEKKENRQDQRIGHIIGHSEIPTQNEAHLRSVN
jgi:integrase